MISAPRCRPLTIKIARARCRLPVLSFAQIGTINLDPRPRLSKHTKHSLRPTEISKATCISPRPSARATSARSRVTGSDTVRVGTIGKLALAVLTMNITLAQPTLAAPQQYKDLQQQFDQ